MSAGSQEADLSLNVRHSRGKKVESQVEIYKSHSQTGSRSRKVRADPQKHLPAVQRNPSRRTVLVLGLLCLLLVGIIVLSRLYTATILEKDQLNNQYEDLKRSYEDLKRSNEKLNRSNEELYNGYCLSEEKERKTAENITRWKRFWCSCYYKSTEMKSWTESRRDCQSRGADLVIINSKEEQEYVRKLNGNGTSWIGLQSQKGNGWEWEWKWVDGTKLTYTAWAKDLNLTPEDEFKGYIDQRGTWNYTKSGSKQWICEKPAY